jgi:hypothetical protein
MLGECGHGRTAYARPELAQILRASAPAYLATHGLAPVQRRAIEAICACRTDVLGGTRLRCERCGAERLVYRSCANRHCPKCQTLAKERWLAARAAELLDIPYFHLVFTLPHALNPLAQGNPRLIYAWLFEAASSTLLEFGANPRWLGGELALTLVLHTWGQNLGQHLHVHALVSAGALSSDGCFVRAHRGFLFPVKALSKVFRAKYLEALQQGFAQLKLAGTPADLAQTGARARWFAQLRAQDWVVYAKAPFACASSVLRYLGRYTHRVALSNERLIAFDQQTVRLRWRDYAHGNRNKVLTLDVEEFIRRFLLHVLPTGFMRIRHYGLNANRSKARKLPAARLALAQPTPPPSRRETVTEFLLRVTGRDPTHCPRCETGRLRVVAIVPPQPNARAPPPHHG